MITDASLKGDFDKLCAFCDSIIDEIDHLIFSPIIPVVEGHRIAALKHDIIASVHHICAIYSDLCKDFDSEVLK